MSGRGGLWHLPNVPAEVARRRRVFFASVTLVTISLAVAPFLMSSSSATRATPPAPRPSSQPLPQGCSLHAGTSVLKLSLALARTLTDLAGRDQNAAASLATTTHQVAVAWPVQASQAAVITLSLRGYVPGALACTGTLPPAQRQAMEPDGLTARANTMWDAIKAVFGPLPAGGFMPGGVYTGHVPGSAHYEGRAIDFFYRPITAKTIRHGWVLAQWLEAHAESLQIATVIFDARIWTPGDWNNRGWGSYNYPEGTTTNPTLLHYDHVHVDVQRGS
jgi:hypothetical protein